MTGTDEGQALVPGLLDTSIFIAQEQRRPIRGLPDVASVSIVTIAELQLGVLLADDPKARAARLRTLSAVEARFQPLPADIDVARMFAELAAEARRARPRSGVQVMDMWIAATAEVHKLTVYTRDDDFDEIPRVRVIRV